MPTFEDFWRDLSTLVTSGEIVQSPFRRQTHYLILEAAPDFAAIKSANELGED